ncbi:hypothetical protein WDW37_20710 [Bdellovibrionota bacterium FG-1]
MIKASIIAFFFGLIGTSFTSFAGMQNEVIIRGTVQGFTGSQIELLDHGKLVTVPRDSFKGDLREGQQIQVEAPLSEVHSSPSERLKYLKSKNMDLKKSR